MAITQARAVLVPRSGWPPGRHTGLAPLTVPRLHPKLLPGTAPLPWPAWSPFLETIWRPGWLNAVSKVGSTVEGTTATTSFTVASGTDSLILVRVAHFQSPGVTVTGVTYNGVALTQAAVADAGGEDYVEIWGLVAPATGAHNVVVSYSGAPAFQHVYIDQFDGVDGTTPFGTGASNTGASTAPSVSVSGATGDMIVDCLGCYIASGFTITSGQTLDEKDEQGAADDSSAASHAAGAASVSMSYTLSSSGNWWICGVALKAAGGGGGPALNDANYAATFRGMGLGMNRGMR